MGWLTDWRRSRVLKKHQMDDDLWRAALSRLPFIKDSQKLRDLVLVFLAEKHFTGAHGFEVTDAIRLSIAAQACLPVLELGLDWYAGWSGIVIYPGDFRVRRSEVDEDGVLHEWDDELAGEAMPGGPVVLSWDAAAWRAAFSVAYQGFHDALERGTDTWLDPYAAEHPSEFFAVISESFFEDPAETKRRYPDVYDQLKLFYKQDPA